MNLKLTFSNYLLFFLVALTIFLQVYTSNQLATSGREIVTLENQAEVLEDENRKLLAESVEDMSLSELKIKAEALGFVEPKEVINLTSPSALASN